MEVLEFKPMPIDGLDRDPGIVPVGVAGDLFKCREQLADAMFAKLIVRGLDRQKIRQKPLGSDLAGSFREQIFPNGIKIVHCTEG